MKKIYTEAEIEVIRFSKEEVIVASSVETTTQPKLDEDELPPIIIM